MEIFKLHFRYFLPFVMTIFFMQGCSSSAALPTLKNDKYVVLSEKNTGSERWGEYLYYHLKKRVNDADVIYFNKDEQKSTRFYIEVVSDLDFQYCITRNNNKVHFKTKDDETALWICYQLIDNIGQEDTRINALDIPPAVIQIKEGCYNFDFDYRDVYSPANIDPDDSGILGNNNVETDWALWGHNLYRIVDKSEETDESVYAFVNQSRKKGQLCFSSEKLFEITSSYIIDNFGFGEDLSYNFMVMPEDNPISCSCDACKELGNTKDNATPAVAAFLTKLSKQFPKHQFFTTAYYSTQTAPENKLPDNCGVFFSTINLPKGIGLNEKQAALKKFLEQTEQWKKATSNLYLWDYSSNFDDYLTPLPILSSIQKQLQFFKSKGIKGVFFNDSGYDYSSFSDVKTFIISSLLKNTELNIEELVSSFLKKKYPKSHLVLSQYFLELEQEYAQKNVPFSIYDGFEDITRTYFNKDSFIVFYEQLESLIAQSDEEEKLELRKLMTALSYTRLQIAYYSQTKKDGFVTAKNESTLKVNSSIENPLSRLKSYVSFENMNYFKEEAGDLSDYIDFWDKIIATKELKNEILNVSIIAHDNKDDLTKLTDGIPGYVNSYHQGWYITPFNFNFSIPTEKLDGAYNIEFNFLNNKKHKFSPPTQIEFLSNGNLIKTSFKDDFNEGIGSVYWFETLDLSDVKELEIRMTDDINEKSSIALDEIRILKI